MVFIPWKPKVSFMYLCTSCGVTFIFLFTKGGGGGVDPTILRTYFINNIVSVVSVPFLVSEPDEQGRFCFSAFWFWPENLFRFLWVLIRTRLRNDRTPSQFTEPPCWNPNRATKLLLEPEPFVAGFQTVQPSCCKDQNPLLQASKPCNQAVARTRTLCCRLPNRATKLLVEPNPFVAGFQTVQPSCC